MKADSNSKETELQVDPVQVNYHHHNIYFQIFFFKSFLNEMCFQVDLLLGKAYSDWGHVSDAVSVYDQLISSHPNDFRGYLAKV